MIINGKSVTYAIKINIKGVLSTTGSSWNISLNRMTALNKIIRPTMMHFFFHILNIT
jgi:hypothetical protein